ncbi:MAG: PqqD family protein [Endomicrobia bacterium]|nr:PqqD family protein [Endomicrobiia bacterium]
MRYRISKEVAFRKIEGEIYIVDVKNSELHKLNDTGSFIWEAINANKTKDYILKKLTQFFDISYEDVEKDFEEFIEELIQKKLLVKVVNDE